MKLYLLTTKGLGDFYMVADSPSDAENTLREELDKANYGYEDNRDVLNIQFLAKELESLRAEEPLFFSSKNNLILTR